VFEVGKKSLDRIANDENYFQVIQPGVDVVLVNEIFSTLNKMG